MVKAESFAEFTQTANRYGRGISNDFMLPGTVEKLIKHGKLYYAATDVALFIFEERDGYMKLTFRVNDATVKMNGATSKMNDTALKMNSATSQKLTAFTVGKGSPGKSDEWLTANGFVLKQERVRYTAARLNVPLTSPVLAAEEIEIVDASVAYPIYRQCFDMVIADLPCPELFEGALCVRGESGEAAGVLSLGADRHIGVLPKYRGRGIATRLYSILAAHEPNLGRQSLFADTDNAASNGLYRKLGFRTDGVVLRCYKLEL